MAVSVVRASAQSSDGARVTTNATRSDGTAMRGSISRSRFARIRK